MADGSAEGCTFYFYTKVWRNNNEELRREHDALTGSYG